MSENGSSSGNNPINSEGRQRMDTQVSGGFLNRFRDVKRSVSEMRRPEKPLVSIEDEAAGITRYDQVVPGKDARKVAFNEIRQAISNARPENRVIPFSELPSAQAEATGASTSESTPADEPKLFSLDPISPAQAEGYQAQAANGFTPQQSEQGQSQIDKIRLEQARQAEADRVEQANRAAIEKAAQEQRDAIDAYHERTRQKFVNSAANQSTQDSPVAEEPKLFSLDPIPQAKADEYKEQAANGFTPQQSEQGQSEINDARIEQANRAANEKAAQEQRDAIEAYRERSKQKFADTAINSASEDSKLISLDPISQAKSEEHQEQAVNGYSALQNEQGQPQIDRISAEQARQAEIAKAAKDQQDAIDAYRERSKLKFADSAVNSSSSVSSEAKVAPLTIAEILALPTSVDKKLNALEEIRDKDPNKPARERDNSNRRIREAERTLVLSQPDEVLLNLASQSPIARDLYMGKLEKKLLENTTEPNAAIDQLYQTYRQILEKSGLSHQRVVANSAELRRKYKKKYETQNLAKVADLSSSGAVAPVDSDPGMFRALDTPNLMGETDIASNVTDISPKAIDVVEPTQEPASVSSVDAPKITSATDAKTPFFDYALTGRVSADTAVDPSLISGAQDTITVTPERRRLGGSIKASDASRDDVRGFGKVHKDEASVMGAGAAGLQEYGEGSVRLGAIEDNAISILRATDAEDTSTDAKGKVHSALRRRLLTTAAAAAIALGVGGGIESEALAPSAPATSGHELVLDTDAIGSEAALTAANISIGGQAKTTDGVNQVDTAGSLSGSDTENNSEIGGAIESAPVESVSGAATNVVETAPDEKEYTTQTFASGEALSDKLAQEFGDSWYDPDVLVVNLLDSNNYDNLKRFYELKTGKEYPTKAEIMDLYDQVVSGKADSAVLWHLGDFVPQKDEMPGSEDEFRIYNKEGVEEEIARIKAEENGLVANTVPATNAASGGAAIGGATAVENMINAPIGDGTGGPDVPGTSAPVDTAATDGSAQVGVASASSEVAPSADNTLEANAQVAPNVVNTASNNRFWTGLRRFGIGRKPESNNKGTGGQQNG